MVSDVSLGFLPGTNANFLSPSESSTVSTPQDATIAPWISAPDDEPVGVPIFFVNPAHLPPLQPTPPPKPTQRLIPTKASLSSLVSGGSSRSGSLVNLPYVHHRPGRLSDAQSFDSSAADSFNSSLSLPHIDSRAELRKPKSSINLLTNMMKKRSRSKLRDDVPSFRSLAHPPVPMLPLQATRKERSMKGKKKSNWSSHSDSTVSLNNLTTSSDTVFRLDTNLDEMDGIVDLSHHHDSSSLSSGIESQPSDVSFRHVPYNSPPTFSDPFLPSASVVRRKHYDNRKISPNTVLPDINIFRVEDDASTSWTAPESWAVEKEGVAKPEEYGSSSEEDTTAVNSPIPGPPTSTSVKRKSRRKAQSSRGGRPNSSHGKSFKIRIYRASNTYHVVSIGLTATVADVTFQLIKKLLDPEREVHRLYLKERGRERVLAMTERPADIMRRRLEQAGYTSADGLDMLGADDMRFLLTFVYKSTLLGPAVGNFLRSLYFSLMRPLSGRRIDL
jgi:adenylate cyclase